MIDEFNRVDLHPNIQWTSHYLHCLNHSFPHLIKVLFLILKLIYKIYRNNKSDMSLYSQEHLTTSGVLLRSLGVGDSRCKGGCPCRMVLVQLIEG